MSFSTPAPSPPSKLGVYRTFGPKAGVRVSPLALGGASIGDKRNELMGNQNKERSFTLLDTYFDLGGNFIDTANAYRDGSSEEFIGEWAEKRGIRDQLFIATKYTQNSQRDDPNITQKPLYIGNSVKSLHLSIEVSLKRLRTSYVDLLYVHWWDYETPVKEVMDALHNLVVQGKVLYLGISDTPAWVVAQANSYAEFHGKTPFVVYQGAWNIMDRSIEREILPMARSLGLAIAPFDIVGGGRFRSNAEDEQRRQSGEKGRMWQGSWERTEDEIKISKALEKVADELGAKNLRSVAIAYVLQAAPYVFPIIGGRKPENLIANLEALDITLSKEQIEYLENVIPFNPGFPHIWIGDGTKPQQIISSVIHFQKVPPLQALPIPELGSAEANK
ncbi:putative aryl-alcohol dehydrogenase aad14 [Stygiomarasmius scandens]|uniref:Aryl-alcohol dehydrogenase aad14 n=1 Tax=Marasmiellus scandens TaxID=2682957 RepID=A0ABR1JM78_9AGAR